VYKYCISSSWVVLHREGSRRDSMLLVVTRGPARREVTSSHGRQRGVPSMEIAPGTRNRAIPATGSTIISGKRAAASLRLRLLIRRAGRCWGLCRYRYCLSLKIHVRIPALENGAKLPLERPYSRL
jgi:hypothetical protein